MAENINSEGKMANGGQFANNQSHDNRIQIAEERLSLLNERYHNYQKNNNYFFHPTIDKYEGAWVYVQGKKMLMLASYSYLGLIENDYIKQEVHKAIDKFGVGTNGVRLLAGTTSLHRDLELEIADFKKTDDAIVFSSGYVTNLAAISTLAGRGNYVICDKLNHASIIDGCTLSRANLMIFKHNDMDDLERCLIQTGDHGKIIVVDAVFSMDGDIIDLPKIVELAKKYKTPIMVDEAHSLGVIGETGHGIEEYFGLDSDSIHVKMGTLSKAIPSTGGYIAGKERLITALRHNARAFIFSASMTPAQAASARASFEVLKNNPQIVKDLQRKTEKYSGALRKLGFDIGNTQTCIVPIMSKTESMTYKMTESCQEMGLFVLPVTFPAVPATGPRLRTAVTALHTDEDIDFAILVLEKSARICGLI